MRKKRIEALLLAVMILVGTIHVSTPVDTKADEGMSASKVSVWIMNDQTQYSNTIPEYKTTTATGLAIGGEVQWNYAIIVIESATGYSVEKAEGKRGNEKITFPITTKGDIVTSNDIFTKMGAGEAKTAFEGISSDQTAFFVGREMYNKLCYGTITILLKDSGNNEISCTLNIQPDSTSVGNNYSLEQGASFTPFVDIQKFAEVVSGTSISGWEEPANDYGDSSNSDWNVHISVTGSTSIIPYSVVYGENGPVITHKGVGFSGTGLVSITSKRTGQTWFLEPIKYLAPDNVPIESIKVIMGNQERNVSINDTLNVYLSPIGDDIHFCEATVKISVVSGASISFGTEGNVTRYGNQNEATRIELDKEATFSMTDYENRVVEADINASYDAANNEYLIHLKSEQALTNILYIETSNGDENYCYQILCTHKYLYNFGNTDTYAITPGKEVDIFDYVTVYGDTEDIINQRKQALIDDVTSGEVSISFGGADLVYSDGVFTGKVVFQGAGYYASIYNEKYVYQLTGSSMNFSNSI